jgi:hypothetical protein
MLNVQLHGSRIPNNKNPALPALILNLNVECGVSVGELGKTGEALSGMAPRSRAMLNVE